MYLNIYYDRRYNQIHLWDENGYEKFKYKPYCYLLAETPDAKYRSLFGDPLKKMEFATVREMKEFKESWEDSVYESDVRPEIRTLIDRYYKEPRSLPDAHVALVDIELDVGREPSTFPDVKEAKYKINAITLYSMKLKTYFCLALRPEPGATVKPIGEHVKILLFDTEEELLLAFMDLFCKLEINIYAGWNSEEFDVPYLFNRISKLMGDDALKKLSRVHIVNYDPQYKKYEIAGTDHVDLMVLFKKFTQNERRSYALDPVCIDELGYGKKEYDGWFGALYYNDFQTFVEYNVQDVTLMVDLDELHGHIELARSLTYKGNVPLSNIIYTSVPLDGAILSYLKNKNLVAPDGRHHGGGGEKIKGGLVSPTRPGEYQWLVDFDFTRLYPSLMETLNISPETKVKKYANNAVALLDEEAKAYYISANGVAYKKDVKGIIPSIIEVWAKERVEYKDEMKKHLALAEKESDPKLKREHENKAKYYNGLQNVVKTYLNSLYGVLVLRSFRFHDLDNAEAITLTGQAAIKYAIDKANELHVKLGSSDSVCASDTDSMFFSMKSILEKMGIDLDDEKKCVATIQESIIPAFNAHLKHAMDEFALKELNAERHFLELKQEFIIRRAFFVAKKNYGMLLVNKEGVDIRKPEFKGLGVVKSTMPPYFKEAQEEIFGAILEGQSTEQVCGLYEKWSRGAKDEDLDKLSMTSGMTALPPQGQKGLKQHHKAAHAYNNYLRDNNIKGPSKIKAGSKLRVIHLQEPNPWQSEVIGYNDDTPRELKEEFRRFLNTDAMVAKFLDEKVKPVFEVCKIRMPEKTAEVFRDFFSFE